MTTLQLTSSLAVFISLAASAHWASRTYPKKVEHQWAKRGVRLDDKLEPFEVWTAYMFVQCSICFTLSGMIVYFSSDTGFIPTYEMSSSNLGSSIFTIVHVLSLLTALACGLTMILATPKFNRKHEWPIRIKKRIKIDK